MENKTFMRFQDGFFCARYENLYRMRFYIEHCAFNVKVLEGMDLGLLALRQKEAQSVHDTH